MVRSKQHSEPGTKGKRVLMMVENSPYPQDIRVRCEALALIESGYAVSVICPAVNRQPLRETIEEVHVYRFSAPPPGDGLWGYLFEYSYSLLSIFFLSVIVALSRGFDYLHTANPPDIIVLIGAFYKLFGKRFVFDQHDLSPEMYWMRFQGKGNTYVHKALLLFEKLSCKLADHVITANQSSKRLVMDRNKIPDERITVVRNGPRIEMMKSIETDISLRQRESFTIVYVGGISVQDGLDYLIRALHHLINDLGRQNFHCYVLGDGSALKTIQKMAAMEYLNAYITFTGWVLRDAVKRYIDSADICVDPDPSNDYNDRCTMIKLMEYMARSKPIVAFDLPEHRVTAGEAAVYARPNDELDFARKIVELMDDPARRAKMGQIGRERVENELAWTYQTEHLLDAYQSIADLAVRSRKIPA